MPEHNYDVAYFQSLVNSLPLSGVLLRWLAWQPAAVQCEAVRLQTDLLRQRRSEAALDKMEEFRFAMLLRAISMMRNVEHQHHRKGKVQNPELLKSLQELRQQRVKAQTSKAAPKRSKAVIRYGETIRSLRDKGFSWGQVAVYLKRYHKIQISRCYLQRLFSKEEGKDDATSCK